MFNILFDVNWKVFILLFMLCLTPEVAQITANKWMEKQSFLKQVISTLDRYWTLKF